MRISREVMFMDACEVFARRSTCCRGNVGAALVKDNDIVSIGYNGPPSGEAHCFGDLCPITDTGGCQRSIHAEENAITRALKKGRVYDLGGFHLYCTYSPCESCANLIVRSHIKRVYYRTTYRLRIGLDKLLSNGVEVRKITPSGIIMDVASNRIID